MPKLLAIKLPVFATAEDGLTATERSILLMLAEGLPYKGIAERRRISFYTVRTHVHNLYEKLGVHSKTEAINKYFGRPEPPG